MKKVWILYFVCLFCLISCSSAPDLTIGGHDWTVQTISMTEGDESLVLYCAPELAEQYPETVMKYYTYSFFPHPDGIENTYLLHSLYKPSPESDYSDSDYSICTLRFTESDRVSAVYDLQVVGDEGDGNTLNGQATVRVTYENDEPTGYTLLLTYGNAEGNMTVVLTAPYTE